ncbi:hypothetical protein CAFE_18580 [Caprobacter fermentans]|uniref:Uncharacterized protein n=1 Tax=Caproicibacter fermentans TaxID=2576756 RepID=A0A6N8HZF9_9FIRM|nr:hypothetical protein [Caproicibacter fermentans]MVB11152.1 hypothetical protein [Caproicibacter fermentans]
MNQEKDIDKIVLHYTDGSTKEVRKGFIAGITENELEETSEATFYMAHISGKDLATVVYAVMQLGIKLNLFGDLEESE